MTPKVIAIDGPSGSGKSTVAKSLAQELNLTYLDTGAMFRAIALVLNEAGIEASADDTIEEFLGKMQFDYGRDENLVYINQENLTEKIREHSVSKLASIYSQNKKVRSYLKELQRKIASERESVLEGRDIGTVIFPDAPLKIYLTATSEVRAKRRYLELLEKGESFSLEKIMADIEKRDFEDKNREIAPLKKAKDAIQIDSDKLTIEEIVKQISILYSKVKVS